MVQEQLPLQGEESPVDIRSGSSWVPQDVRDAPDAPEAESPEVEEPQLDQAQVEQPEVTDPVISERERELQAELDQYRQREAQIRRQQAEFEQRQQEAQIAQLVNQEAQRLQQQYGMTAEDAMSEARRVGQLYQTSLDTRREAAAKQQTAEMFARQYGVSSETLMQYNSPEAMELAAQYEQRFQAMQKDIEGVKRSQVPAQRFEGGRGGASQMSDREYLRAYGRGEVHDTQRAAEISKRLGFNR